MGVFLLRFLSLFLQMSGENLAGSQRARVHCGPSGSLFSTEGVGKLSFTARVNNLIQS